MAAEPGSLKANLHQQLCVEILVLDQRHIDSSTFRFFHLNFLPIPAKLVYVDKKRPPFNGSTTSDICHSAQAQFQRYG